MSKSVELTDETYQAIAARVAQIGVTPAQLLALDYGVALPIVQPKPGETLYDRLKDYVGRYEGTNPHASKNTGKQIADYLEQKYREGRL
jgi:hypothetical protein